MDRDEYMSLGQRLDHPGTKVYEAVLDAGKPNGNTYLDLGGVARINIEEDDIRGTVLIHFEADDGTKGVLTIPRTVLDESIDLSDTSDNY